MFSTSSSFSSPWRHVPHLIVLFHPSIVFSTSSMHLNCLHYLKEKVPPPQRCWASSWSSVCTPHQMLALGFGWDLHFLACFKVGRGSLLVIMAFARVMSWNLCHLIFVAHLLTQIHLDIVEPISLSSNLSHQSPRHRICLANMGSISSLLNTSPNCRICLPIVEPISLLSNPPCHHCLSVNEPLTLSSNHLTMAICIFVGVGMSRSEVGQGMLRSGGSPCFLHWHGG